MASNASAMMSIRRWYGENLITSLELENAERILLVGYVVLAEASSQYARCNTHDAMDVSDHAKGERARLHYLYLILSITGTTRANA